MALDWVLKNGDFVTETTVVGLVFSGLSHMTGVETKAEFSCGLLRGLGSNLTIETRTKLAKEVPADVENTLKCIVQFI